MCQLCLFWEEILDLTIFSCMSLLSTDHSGNDRMLVSSHTGIHFSFHHFLTNIFVIKLPNFATPQHFLFSHHFNLNITTEDYATLPFLDPSIISNKNWQSGTNPGWTIGIGDDGRLEFNAGDGSN